MATTVATASVNSGPPFLDHTDKNTAASDTDDSKAGSLYETELSPRDTRVFDHSIDYHSPTTVSSTLQNDKANTEPLTIDNASTCTSSSASSYSSESKFEKPTRTYSEDTTVTTPEAEECSLNKNSVAVTNKETTTTTTTTTISTNQERLDNDCQQEMHSSAPVKDISPNVTKRIQEDMEDISLADFILNSQQLSAVDETVDKSNERMKVNRMQDISLEDEVLTGAIGRRDQKIKEKHSTTAADQKTFTNHLGEITSALVSGKKPDITVPAPAPTRSNTTYSATEFLQHMRQRNKNRSDSVNSDQSNSTFLEDIDTRSVASSSASTTTSTVANRSIFSFWSPFRSSSSSSISTTTSPATSRRPSKQTSTIITTTKTASRPVSIISPLPGFQEALLAQMEQLNAANTSDPKSKVMQKLKRQSIRHSLVTQNKGDDYDWDFWAGFMCDYQNFDRVNKDIVKHIRFGIPPSIRGMVWQLLAKSKDEALVSDYIHLLKETSPYDKMIQRDLARTFPGHTYFKDTEGQGQEGLYNVVRAYSLYDTEVGYCQGLAFIVGPMLLNMPDEDAFCVLIQLMKKYGLRGHFTPEMEGLQLRLYQFDVLMQDHLPHIARHLKQQGINSTMYASQWFMTLFAYKFPLNLVFRIYDVIFTEGISSIFKFALALLKRNQTTILGLDFEQLLVFLKDGLFEEYKADDKLFVSDACELDISTKKLTQLAKEYKLQLKREQADANAIEELQKSNLKLKKQLEDLQTKTNGTKREKEDVDLQLQGTLNELRSLQEEQTSLVMLVSSLKSAVDILPRKIEEATNRGEFENLCSENAELTSKNLILEDQLQKAEATLIDIKMQYAESENEREELQKRLYELKKIMSF